MQIAHQLKTTSQLMPGWRPLERIMSLDDEAIDQMVCKRVVRRANLAQELISFTTPAAALSYFANPDNPEIDLILLDVHMPRMNGFEFLRAAEFQLESKPVPPVIIMLTTPLGPIHQAEADGFDVIKAFLDKPLDPLELQDVCTRIQNAD